MTPFIHEADIAPFTRKEDWGTARIIVNPGTKEQFTASAHVKTWTCSIDGCGPFGDVKVMLEHFEILGLDPEEHKTGYRKFEKGEKKRARGSTRLTDDGFY